MRLKDLRESAGMTQDELAERLGIKRTTYRSYELGISQMPFETLFKLSDMFDVTPNDLLNYRKGEGYMAQAQ